MSRFWWAPTLQPRSRPEPAAGAPDDQLFIMNVCSTAQPFCRAQHVPPVPCSAPFLVNYTVGLGSTKHRERSKDTEQRWLVCASAMHVYVGGGFWGGDPAAMGWRASWWAGALTATGSRLLWPRNGKYGSAAAMRKAHWTGTRRPKYSASNERRAVKRTACWLAQAQRKPSGANLVEVMRPGSSVRS